MSIAHPTRAPRSRRLRNRVAAAGTAVLVAGVGLLTAAPAQAAEVPVEGGSVHWGYKQTFRAYVAGFMNTLPDGQQITVTAPAQFDPNGTPAVPANTATPNETLPYTLPIAAGTFTDAANFTVQTAGTFAYHFPDHFFDSAVSNLAVVVTNGAASITADVATTVTADFGNFQEGEYGGTGVTIANIATPGISITGDTLTLSATGVTVSEAGAEAMPFYGVGEALDDLTLTASLGEDTTAPTEWSPQLSVSKQTGFNPDGSETVTVTGTGFDPNANLSTRLPVTVGQPSGVYVVFGKFADNWRPSVPDNGGRTVISQKWAMPLASKEQVSTQFPSQAAALVELSPDGSFTAELTVAPNETVAGNYGVYTYAGGGAAANADQELYVPIGFAGDLDIGVTIPTDTTDPGDPGEFLWRVQGGATAVDLGTAAVSGDRFAASGALAPIIVTDTRLGGLPWSVSAQVSDFVGSAGTFSGSNLGWAPAVTSAGAGAVAGAVVDSGFVSGDGLAQSRTLGSAVEGHEGGSATLGALLDLQLPLTTPAGDYTGTLTITAVS